jgi:PII-like signaling protein
MSIIDTEEQIARLTQFLDAMVEEGLVAASTVEVIRYSRRPGELEEKP